jgi:hypothetical protein
MRVYTTGERAFVAKTIKTTEREIMQLFKNGKKKNGLIRSCVLR